MAVFDELEKELLEFEKISLDKVDNKSIEHLANLAVQIYEFHKRVRGTFDRYEVNPNSIDNLENYKPETIRRLTESLMDYSNLPPYSWKTQLAKYAIPGVGIPAAVATGAYYAFKDSGYESFTPLVAVIYSMMSNLLIGPRIYDALGIRRTRREVNNEIEKHKEKLSTYMKELLRTFHDDINLIKKSVETSRKSVDYYINRNGDLIDIYGNGDLEKAVDVLKEKTIDYRFDSENEKWQRPEYGDLHNLSRAYEELSDAKYFLRSHNSLEKNLKKVSKSLNEYRRNLSPKSSKMLVVLLPLLVIATSLFFMFSNKGPSGALSLPTGQTNIFLSLIVILMSTIITIKIRGFLRRQTN